MKTAEDVAKAVRKGFVPFKAELIREITDDDIEHLLQIPIRRISLFDINKNREQVLAINARLKEIAKRLKHLTACAVEYLEGMIEKFKKLEETAKKEEKDFSLERHTQLASFSAVDVKEVARRDISLRYDDKGYLGTNVSGGRELMKVTPFDRVFVVRKSGIFTVCDVPDRLFVDKGMYWCNLAEKEIIQKVLWTVIYKDPKTGYAYIKRCRVADWIMNRDYSFAPDGMEVLHVDTRQKFTFTLKFVKKPRMKIHEQTYKAQSFDEKGFKAAGVRLEARELESVEVEPVPEESGQGKLL